MPTDTKAGEAPGPWLAELLAAVLVRAAELDVRNAPEPAPAAWAAAWAAFFPLLARHLATLQVPPPPAAAASPRAAASELLRVDLTAAWPPHGGRGKRLKRNDADAHEGMPALHAVHQLLTSL